MEKEIKEELSEEIEAASELGNSEESADNADKAEQISELTAQLTEAKIRLELLLAGADKERLDEGARLAEGLCAAGKSPEEAAAEVVAEYPHLRAVQREIPQLSAQSGGSSDGFAAIRRIFAKK